MDSPPPSRASPLGLWRPVVLVLILAVLVVSTFRSMRSDTSESADDSARLILGVSVQSRLLYLQLEGPAAFRASRSVDRQKRGLLKDVRRLASIAHGSATIRKMAVLQYELGDPGWQATLLRLRGLPGAGSAFEVEHELATWRLAFSGHPSAAQMVDVRRQIDRLRLGWYGHVALAAAYRNAGDRARSASERSAAMESPVLIEMVAIGAVLAILLGFVIGLVVVIWLSTRHLHQTALPAALEPAAPEPLDRSRANVLYTAFIVFLATFAALRFLGADLLRPWLERSHAGATGIVIASTALTLLEVAVPLLFLLVAGRHVGLRAADFGWRSRNLLADIGWGIGGYLMALPAVIIVSLIANFLFNVLLPHLNVHIQTPTNPAITQFVASPSALVKVFLFVQAAMLAPFAEETLFRGIFFRGLSARMSTVAALLVASGVFAILHPQLPLGFFAIFVLGALFNGLYLLRGSIVPNMVAHAINNGAIVLFLTLVVGS